MTSFIKSVDLTRYGCFIFIKVLQNEDGKMWKEHFGIPNAVEDMSKQLVSHECTPRDMILDSQNFPVRQKNFLMQFWTELYH